MPQNNSTKYHTIETGLAQVKQRIHQAIARRDLVSKQDNNTVAPCSNVQLLAVSKTKTTDEIFAAFEAGQTAFGENYVQEGVDKIQALQALPIEWHFIGELQSNKTRLVAENFHWFQSLDRLRIARRLSQQRLSRQPPLQVLIQLNIDQETTKGGIAPQSLLPFAQEVLTLPHLTLRGIMCIPKPQADLNLQAQSFRACRIAFEELKQLSPKIDTLSMGMSQDLEQAILEGATLVRVGTDIFGARS